MEVSGSSTHTHTHTHTHTNKTKQTQTMNERPRLLDVGAAAHMGSGGMLAVGIGQWTVML